MCRNIKTLANFEPPASDDEIRASALQFVRKLSGTNKPSKANEEAFNQRARGRHRGGDRADTVAQDNAPPRNREEERQKAKERSIRRFA